MDNMSLQQGAAPKPKTSTTNGTRVVQPQQPLQQQPLPASVLVAPVSKNLIQAKQKQLPRTRQNSTVSQQLQDALAPTHNYDPPALPPVPTQIAQHQLSFSTLSGLKQTIVYNADKVIGNGSFGVVFMARIAETSEPVAIKRVLQDKRFKNRELQMMKMLKHKNVVEMKHCYYENQDAEKTYLNLVLEYVPDTVFRFCCQYAKNNDYVPLIYVKVRRRHFKFYFFPSYSCSNSVGLLIIYIRFKFAIVTSSHKICSLTLSMAFWNCVTLAGTGKKIYNIPSAKQLSKGEPNVSYICSRYYRAPELIFGAQHYTTTIDVWSMGCVMGELLIGQPLFPGDSSVDQLCEIMKVLGTPTREEIDAMNKNYTEFKFPTVKAHPWSKIFGERKPVTPPEALDLIQKFLQYNPKKRLKPIEALAHPFFDELRDTKTRLPNGKPLPALFDLTPSEWAELTAPELKYKILPSHMHDKL